MISKRHKFIFFHVPKAAGSSVLETLNRNLKDKGQINDKNIQLVEYLKQINAAMWPNHIKCQLMKDFLGASIFNQYFKFAFVRNPWDKLVSLYHYVKQKETKIYASKGIELPKFNRNIIESESFDDWVKKGNLGDTQFKFLTSKSGNLLVDYIGKTENLQSDFSYICGLLNIPNITLSQVNKSKRADYREYFTQESIDIVNEKFKNDIYLFGYNFDSEEDKETNPAPYLRLLKKQPNSNIDIQVDKILKKNKFVELPENLQEQHTLLHTNKVDEDPLEIILNVKGVNNQAITQLEFACSAYNANSINQGVLLKIIFESEGLIEYQELFTLQAQMVHNINIKLPKKLHYTLKIVALNRPEAKNNHCCGIRISPLVFS